MTRREILKFVEQNDKDNIDKYNAVLLEKLRDLNKRNDRISILLIILTIIFFFASKVTESSLQLGPFVIKDFTLLTKLAPPVFAFSLVEFALVNGHRAETIKVIKWIFLSRFNQTITEKDFNDGHTSFYLRLFLPFSIWNDILKLDEDKKIGCGMVLLFLPLFAVFLWPFYFEYVSIKNLIQHNWAEWTTKISVGLSIYLNIIFFYYYIRPWRERMKTSVDDLTP